MSLITSVRVSCFRITLCTSERCRGSHHIKNIVSNRLLFETMKLNNNVEQKSCIFKTWKNLQEFIDVSRKVCF